jgi:hypothetical protein
MWGRSGFRVLAAHHKIRWDSGLLFVGGGRERHDAWWGAVWCAGPVVGLFSKAMVEFMDFQYIGGYALCFEVGGAESLGGTKFKIWKVVPCCVLRLVCLRIQ